jgi:hypothetical protein
MGGVSWCGCGVVWCVRGVREQVIIHMLYYYQPQTVSYDQPYSVLLLPSKLSLQLLNISYTSKLTSTRSLMLRSPLLPTTDVLVPAQSSVASESDMTDVHTMQSKSQAWHPHRFESEFGEHLHTETGSEDDIWKKILPFEFKLLRNYMILRPLPRIIYQRFMYILALFLFSYTLLSLFDTSSEDHVDTPLAQTIMFVIQALAYIFLPFISMNLLDEVLKSSDIPILFSEALQFDPYFRLKFQIMTHINFIMAVIGVTTYALFGKNDVVTVIAASFFTLLFFTPYVYAFCIILLMLEAYRLQSLKFIADMKLQRHHLFLDHMTANDSTESDSITEDVTLFLPSPSEDESHSHTAGLLARERGGEASPRWTYRDMIDRYYTLHARCMYTSRRRGWRMLALFLYSGLTAIGGAYGAFTRQYNFLSIFVLTLIPMLVELQIGCSLATVNEMATQVCRELCTTQLCSLRHKTITSAADDEALNTFLNCIVFAKLEIYFFGNFALRSSTLLAIMGSIAAAIIPSIIYRTT